MSDIRHPAPPPQGESWVFVPGWGMAKRQPGADGDFGQEAQELRTQVRAFLHGEDKDDKEKPPETADAFASSEGRADGVDADRMRTRTELKARLLEHFYRTARAKAEQETVRPANKEECDEELSQPEAPSKGPSEEQPETPKRRPSGRPAQPVPLGALADPPTPQPVLLGAADPATAPGAAAASRTVSRTRDDVMEREVMRMERLLEKAAARESLSPARGHESPAAYECDKASAATDDAMGHVDKGRFRGASLLLSAIVIILLALSCPESLPTAARGASTSWSASTLGPAVNATAVATSYFLPSYFLQDGTSGPAVNAMAVTAANPTATPQPRSASGGCACARRAPKQARWIGSGGVREAVACLPDELASQVASQVARVGSPTTASSTTRGRSRLGRTVKMATTLLALQLSLAAAAHLAPPAVVPAAAAANLLGNRHAARRVVGSVSTSLSNVLSKSNAARKFAASTVATVGNAARKSVGRLSAAAIKRPRGTTAILIKGAPLLIVRRAAARLLRPPPPMPVAATVLGSARPATPLGASLRAWGRLLPGRAQSGAGKTAGGSVVALSVFINLVALLAP